MPIQDDAYNGVLLRSKRLMNPTPYDRLRLALECCRLLVGSVQENLQRMKMAQPLNKLGPKFQRALEGVEDNTQMINTVVDACLGPIAKGD